MPGAELGRFASVCPAPGAAGPAAPAATPTAAEVLTRFDVMSPPIMGPGAGAAVETPPSSRALRSQPQTPAKKAKPSSRVEQSQRRPPPARGPGDVRHCVRISTEVGEVPPPVYAQSPAGPRRCSAPTGSCQGSNDTGHSAAAASGECAPPTYGGSVRESPTVWPKGATGAVCHRRGRQRAGTVPVGNAEQARAQEGLYGRREVWREPSAPAARGINFCSSQDEGRSFDGLTPMNSPSFAPAMPPSPTCQAGARSITSSSDLIWPAPTGSPAQTPGPSQSQGWPSRYLTDFLVLGELGKGHFGKVVHVRSRLQGGERAVKITETLITGERDRERRLLEARALGCCSSPYVVRYYSCWIEEARLYLETEYCPGGALADVIATEGRQPWREGRLAVFTIQMLMALRHLHEDARIAHLDLKPDNIYISRGAYKLGDFGHAHWLPGGRTPPASPKEKAPLTPTTPTGTDARVATPITISGDSRGSRFSCEEGDVRYLPLDMLNEKHALQEADLFALGITLLELATGQPLPKNDSYWQRLRLEAAVEVPATLASFQRQPFPQMVASLMHRDPTARPLALQLLTAAGGRAEDSWLASAAQRDHRVQLQLAECSGALAARALARSPQQAWGDDCATPLPCP
eukprot:TRINITY_DN17479_c0_g1_i1.p1 TRINITY_DN17479_c0_g1~~TRINITY_DN17479_c0_g1_i1.p1  ORF type:complete len:669 (+),score=138.54 TRINITY_DN17479_c0_g1_i1:106-2007(+)